MFIIYTIIPMGNIIKELCSKGVEKPTKPTFEKNKDFKSYSDLQTELKKKGIESCNTLVFIDFTKSNEKQGEKSFGRKNLHTILPEGMNQYQYALYIINKTLNEFDEDDLIPAFGFGCIKTKHDAVFPFIPDRPCKGFAEILSRYNHIVPQIQLSGLTSFAPSIYTAIDIVRKTKSYHIMIIIADGILDDKTCRDETIAAIVAASYYPLSIIMIGVGDGPWHEMEKFDDELPDRLFDNFQFVQFTKIINMNKEINKTIEIEFAYRATMEIAPQYEFIKSNGLTGKMPTDYINKSKIVNIDFDKEGVKG